jgi:ATP-dependent helicase/nuclease subunit A
MTIHKSKGLGFDVVITPDLQGNRIDERRGGLAVQKAEDRRVEWVLDLPPKMFVAADEVLTQHVRGAEAEACYEALSLLYVAFTRAKRALYVIVEPARKSTSRNYPRLLAETLGEAEREVQIGALTLPGAWTSGDAMWHLQVEPEKKTSEPGASAVDSAVAPENQHGSAGIAEPSLRRSVRRAALRPSRELSGRVPAAQLFTLERRAGAEFGAEVHALLAEIEWGDAAEVNALAQRWGDRGTREEAITAVLACLRAPELLAVWRQPGPGATVWRERAFEIVLDDAWVSGVFDRVVIERDSAGRPVRAAVFDFKTDVVDNESQLAAAVGRHRAQLNLYRRVAAVLTGLSSTEIAAELVFTALRRSRRMEPELW